MEKAILIIGHGSRSKEAQVAFNKIVESMKIKKTYKHVFGAHMENASPSIVETVDQIYKMGIREIIVLPYFLYSGIHIKEDIPETLDEIKKKYNDLNFKTANPLGFDQSLVHLLLKRAKEVDSK